MKIIHLDIWPVTMALREPYTIAYETISTTTNIFLKIQTNSGIHAYGCAAPDLEVTGETPEGVMALFKQKVEPFLHGQNPFRIHWLMEVIRQECPKSPSLLAMVDMALYDLLAKKAGLPLYQLLGGYRDSIPTSITVGIMAVAETLERPPATDSRCSSTGFRWQNLGGDHRPDHPGFG